MEFKIESGIPVAPLRGGKGRPRKYPFDKMNVGDSFAVPCEGKRYRAIQATLNGCVRVHGIGKFVTHYLEAENVIRVWRVE